jgi:hypothetical protein
MRSQIAFTRSIRSKGTSPVVLRFASLVLTGLGLLWLGSTTADARTANLDKDPRSERLVLVPARLPYFSAPIVGRTWAVIDTSGGRRVVARLGPPGERLNPPRIADRNGDGVPDLFIEAQAGNSLFFGEIWQWNGQRARRLWALDLAPARYRESPGEVLVGPLATRFPDEDGDGVHDVVVDAGLAQCRACPLRSSFDLRWRYSARAGRWVFLGIEDH